MNIIALLSSSLGWVRIRSTGALALVQAAQVRCSRAARYPPLHTRATPTRNNFALPAILGVQLTTALPITQPSRPTSPWIMSSPSVTSPGGTKRKRGAEMKFYAVRQGHEPGVYHSWADCKAQIMNYRGAVCTLPLIIESHSVKNRTDRQQTKHSLL